MGNKVIITLLMINLFFVGYIIYNVTEVQNQVRDIENNLNDSLESTELYDLQYEVEELNSQLYSLQSTIDTIEDDVSNMYSDIEEVLYYLGAYE